MKNDTIIFLGVLVAVGVVVFVVTRPTVAPSVTAAARDAADTSTSWLRGAVAKITGGISSGSDASDYSDAVLNGYAPPAAPAGSTVGQGPSFTGWWG
jgi:hypothetical protein